MKFYNKLYYKNSTIQVVEISEKEGYIILENDRVKKEIPLKIVPGCGYTYQFRKKFIRTEETPEKLYKFYKYRIQENFDTIWVDGLIYRYLESEV